MLAERNPQMRKGVGVLKELSADERTRMLYEAREMARRDIASMTGGAIKQAKFEIARNMIADGDPIDKIIRNTGLTHEEVESLR